MNQRIAAIALNQVPRLQHHLRLLVDQTAGTLEHTRTTLLPHLPVPDKFFPVPLKPSEVLLGIFAMVNAFRRDVKMRIAQKYHIVIPVSLFGKERVRCTPKCKSRQSCRR